MSCTCTGSPSCVHGRSALYHTQICRTSVRKVVNFCRKLRGVYLYLDHSVIPIPGKRRGRFVLLLSSQQLVSREIRGARRGGRRFRSVLRGRSRGIRDGGSSCGPVRRRSRTSAQPPRTTTENEDQTLVPPADGRDRRHLPGKRETVPIVADVDLAASVVPSTVRVRKLRGPTDAGRAGVQDVGPRERCVVSVSSARVRGRLGLRFRRGLF